MARFWKALISCALLAGLANCSTPAKRPARLTRVPGGLLAPRPAVDHAARHFTSAPSIPADGTSLVVSNPVPTAGPADADNPASNSNQPSDGWISLETWSQTNTLGSPQRLLSATNLVYELHTANGVITLTAGSQLAQFNGLAYWLGFAPRFTNGHFLVHAIDAQKNFLPLAGFAEPASGTNPIVVIDPGHGGENVGTRSILNNRFEKEYTLDWALRLQSLLASTGWKVVMTRTNDVDVSLADRVTVAEEAGARLFISLHFNSAFPRQDQAGFETFCLTPGGLPSTLTRDFEDDPARSFPNNTYDNENLQYGVRLHRAVVEATGGVDRGVRRARFMGVLRGQSRPAVLLEGGYLSNPGEAARIATAEYRQKLAEAVAGALAVTNATRRPIEAAEATWKVPMSRAEHILVTGGAGFIGSHLVERLLAEGTAVTVIDDCSTGSLDNLRAVSSNSRLRIIQAKVSECRELADVVTRSESIYHLAAAVGVELVVNSPIRTIQTNLRETEAILEAASQAGVPVLLASTSEVYGKSQRSVFSEEDDLLIGPPHLGRWSYACSKLMDEFLAMAHARERRLPIIIARLFNTVGPRQTGRYGMVLPRFIEAAKSGRPLRVYGDGRQTRCFCFVGDTIEALVRLMRTSPAVGEVVNVGSEEEVAIVELASRVVSLMKSSSPVELVPYDLALGPGFEDMQRRRPSVEKLWRLTAFRPSHRLEEIIGLIAGNQ